MESHHLTTRTYTADTCELIVSVAADRLAHSPEQSSHPVDFTLHLDRAELGEIVDRAILQGQPQQLAYLHQIVSQHIAELIAKFPFPTANRQLPSAADRSPQSDSVQNQSDPQPSSEITSARSGIIKNLPGLRDSLPQSPSPNNLSGLRDSIPQSPPKNIDPRSNFDFKPSISKLLGDCQQPEDRLRSDLRNAASGAGERTMPPSIDRTAPTLPYLSEIDDRSLDRQLHLGTLSTTAPSEVLTLSAIQLFDLAAVLDEYAAQFITNQPETLSRASIFGNASRFNLPDPTATSRSRFPTSPKLPTEPEPSQVYYRTRRSRASFMSGIPWAIAAAIGVGTTLLLLDPNSNPIKDAASKLKVPGLAGGKKSVTATATEDRSTTPSPNSPSPSTSLPTPWQAQPVQPPASNKPAVSASVPTTQDVSQIGIAPLPDAIIGQSTTDSIAGTTTSTIAPNPVKSTQLPTDLNKSETTSGVPTTNSTPNSGIKPTGMTATIGNRSKPSASPTTTTSKPTTTIGQLPIENTSSGKVSVSKQPALMPPANLTPIGSNSAASTPVPFDPPNMDTPARQSTPPTTKPQTPKKPDRQVKPTSVVNKIKPQPAKSTDTTADRSTPFEPFTPILTNPNLIDPNLINNSGSDAQNPPVVPTQPLQSNAGKDADPINSPSLEETKRYFQGKWKASTTQPNALQYVLQVSGKSGVVQSVSPQGEAATTYLQQSKLIKPGQKLISPAAAGSSDRKIRVLLQPDGGVDTFIEP
jgi:hypothetical protein